MRNQDISIAMPYLKELSTQVRNADNIWTVIEILTNSLGSVTGRHMETLLFREIAKELANRDSERG